MELHIIAIIIIVVVLICLSLMYIINRSQKTKQGVYCVGRNIHRYIAAKDLALSLGSRLATPLELKQSCSGRSWNVLGWCSGKRAYTCKNGILQGGKLPGQLKLGVYMYGFKPRGSIASKLLIT